jgi:hypothetical protein
MLTIWKMLRPVFRCFLLAAIVVTAGSSWAPIATATSAELDGADHHQATLTRQHARPAHRAPLLLAALPATRLTLAPPTATQLGAVETHTSSLSIVRGPVQARGPPAST